MIIYTYKTETSVCMCYDIGKYKKHKVYLTNCCILLYISIHASLFIIYIKSKKPGHILTGRFKLI